MYKIFKQLLIAAAFASGSVQAAEWLFIVEGTKLFIDNEKLYFATDDKPILVLSKLPAYGSIGSVKAYFPSRGLIITRVDRGTSCPAGAWYAIDITTALHPRGQKKVLTELNVPACDEVEEFYSDAEGKITVQLKQKGRTFKFGF